MSEHCAAACAATQQLAAELVCAKLHDYGNHLSDAHRDALKALTGDLVSLAFGEKCGRLAYPLSCGLGKTQSVVAVCAAFHQLQHNTIAVAVAASKVEALCEMKRDMIAFGIPAEKIGLVHSYEHDSERALRGEEGFASLPSTDINHTRPFLLVTHNRIKGSGPRAPFDDYQGAPRSLLVWDESLLVSETRAISFIELESALGWVKPRLEADSAVASYLTDALRMLRAELDRQQSGSSAPQPITLAQLSGDTIGRFRRELHAYSVAEPLRHLLNMSTESLRAIYTTHKAGAGLVTYDIAVPAELQSIAILDASYSIRELERLDTSIKLGMRVSPTVKLHNEVTIYNAVSGSGRSSMTKDFTSNRRVSAAVCETVQTIPTTEAVIIWTFKPRPEYSGARKGRPVEFAAILANDLRAAGINVDATVKDGGARKPRFLFPTWGQETSTSEFAYASNMIFAGVLHRNLLDLASCIVGQRDDLWAPVSHTEVTAVLNSEIAHSVYQALNRGSCRFVEGNQARAMKAWLIHRHPSLRTALNEVMPGLQWKNWESEHLAVGLRSKYLQAISAYLAAIPPERTRISVTEMKRDLAIEPTAARTTFARALQDWLRNHDQSWVQEDRSLVRVTFDFGCTPTAGAQQHPCDADDENKHQPPVSL